MSSKGPIFRMFNPKGRSKEESVEKRREQVRQAQHVYRQRKTRYVKSLEGDIASSRRRERQILDERQSLEQEVQMLVHLLEQHGIATPNTPLSQDAWANSRQAPVLSPFSTSFTDDASLSLKVSELDQTTLGMKFVLKIEEPCLGHVHGDPSRPGEPSGHALTATSQLLSLTSSPPPPKRSSLLPVENTPASILSRMLALAPAVSNEGEMTPIQAWDAIRRKPVLGSLDLKTVMILAEKLRDAGKCHSFGAVMDGNTFNQLVRDVMVSSMSLGVF